MSAEARVREVRADAPPAPFDEGLDVFRPPDDQRRAVTRIAEDPRGCAFVAERNGRTVGYVTFHPPGELETWGADRTGRLIELGAIEVAPEGRGSRLAERLLKAAFADGRFDDTVVFATLYVWHYDLERTGLGPFAYRRLLERLYRSVGLTARPTSDPEVRSDGANALVVRVGPNAPEEIAREFHRLRTRPPELAF
jgi:acetoin utilization protein AcuA